MRKLLFLLAAVFLFSQAAFAGQDLRSVLEKELDGPAKLPDQKSVVFFVGVPQYGILKDAGGGHFALSDCIEMDVAPFVYGDRVYVPARPLLNAAGIPDENISFAGNEVRAEAYPGTEYSISLTISLDRPRLAVNGREWPTYGPPVVKDGRTCLPVREIGEALAYAVYWQDPTDDAPGTVTFLSLFDTQASRSGSARDALRQAREAAEKVAALSDVTLTYPVDEKYLDSMYNARLAAERINGTVLQPGEIFSFNSATGPRTLKNGFKYGLGFLGPDVGSGVCRTATILYQAARAAGLEIVERHTHEGGDAPYASHEDDAAVQWNVADLKFKNSLSFPVKIVIVPVGDDSLRAKIVRLAG